MCLSHKSGYFSTTWKINPIFHYSAKASLRARLRSEAELSPYYQWPVVNRKTYNISKELAEMSNWLNRKSERIPRPYLCRCIGTYRDNRESSISSLSRRNNRFYGSYPPIAKHADVFDEHISLTFQRVMFYKLTDRY